MPVSSRWIRFSYKPPYSSLPGREIPYDFLVVYAYYDLSDRHIEYNIDRASVITNKYKQNPDQFLAWRNLDEYRS